MVVALESQSIRPAVVDDRLEFVTAAGIYRIASATVGLLNFAITGLALGGGEVLIIFG